MSEDDITQIEWKFLRVAYSWEHESWALYEQTKDRRLVFYDGFWESEEEASAALDEYNNQNRVPL